MGRYHAPGVYVEEVSAGARPIEAVGASTAAFVGVAPDTTAHLRDPQAINNWTQFQREFYPKDKSEDKAGDVLELSVVKDEDDNPVRDADGNLQRRFFEMENGEPKGSGIPLSDKALYLSQAVYGFFLNGGSRCYVVNVGTRGSIKTGLDLLARKDEVAIVAAPGRLDAHGDLLTHCEGLKDRMAILDGPESVKDVDDLIRAAGGPEGNDEGKSGLRPPASPYGAFYFPWIVVRDPAYPDETVKVPPSGHMAGIWARSEAARGVHKAPANEPVRGALDLTYHLTRAEQEELNPAGVNCLRWFSQEGILVWGARTVDRKGSEWKYLNVRRLFNVIEESIARSTRWIVFEPNDYTLWKSIRRDISAFLMTQWRAGALMGKTPAEAFFVKCDEETNPQESIDLGQVVAIIGIAPVKPAEFVIFKLMQTPTGAKTDVQGG